MKIRFTLLNFLLFILLSAGAQNVTGIWKGYFVQSSFGFYEDRYKFEIQLDQAGNNAIAGVTYSYKTTVFYGKASLQGIYTPKTKNLVINEIKLVELKITDKSEPCLMTCYLEYSKMGNLETLTGTYTSRHLKGKDDCGSGKVYLERTTNTDFYKEDFLLKKNNQKKGLDDIAKKPGSKPLNYPEKKIIIQPKKSTTEITKPKIKPGAEDALTKKIEKQSTVKPPIASNTPTIKDEVVKVKPIEKLPPKPEVLKRRNNELVKTLYTSSKEIKIELYDNGEIDGDTITVYHNNQLIISKKRLTGKPITITVKADDESPLHEFVMVAENLGSIPPNTALMVVTAGSKRYELFLTSTEQKNAVVVLEYKPGGTP